MEPFTLFMIALVMLFGFYVIIQSRDQGAAPSAPQTGDPTVVVARPAYPYTNWWPSWNWSWPWRYGPGPYRPGPYRPGPYRPGYYGPLYSRGGPGSRPGPGPGPKARKGRKGQRPVRGQAQPKGRTTMSPRSYINVR